LRERIGNAAFFAFYTKNAFWRADKRAYFDSIALGEEKYFRDAFSDIAKRHRI
jgi:hypothetical protein